MAAGVTILLLLVAQARGLCGNTLPTRAFPRELYVSALPTRAYPREMWQIMFLHSDGIPSSLHACVALTSLQATATSTMGIDDMGSFADMDCSFVSKSHGRDDGEDPEDNDPDLITRLLRMAMMRGTVDLAMDELDRSKHRKRRIKRDCVPTFQIVDRRCQVHSLGEFTQCAATDEVMNVSDQDDAVAGHAGQPFPPLPPHAPTAEERRMQAPTAEEQAEDWWTDRTTGRYAL